MPKNTKSTEKKVKQPRKIPSRRVPLKLPTDLPKQKTASSRPGPKVVLQALGLHSVNALDRFEPYRNARLLIASGDNDIDLSELSGIVNVEYAKRPITEASGWPISSLLGLSSIHASALERAGIHTIADLAELGNYADRVLAAGKEDNGFQELPSAPAELLPSITGAVSTTYRYSSFVRSMDIRGLRLGLDIDCIETMPIAGQSSADQLLPLIDDFLKETGIKDADRHGLLAILKRKISDVSQYHLGEIFTKIKCPVFYLGYLVEHHQDWINLGTYLGDVKSSVCLAPGESRQIAFLDWNRRQNLNRQEDTDKDDQLTVAAVHSRVLEEVVQAVAIEHQMGGTETEANTSTLALSAVGSAALAGGLSAGLGGAAVGAGIGTLIEPGLGTAIGAGVGGVAGGAIGGAAGAVYSSSQLMGMIHASSEGDRDISAELNQQITQSTQQNIGLKQSLFSTVVLDDAQAEQVQASTRNITNYNHMHSLNVLYYEVLQHYLIRTHVKKIEPLLYLPYRFMEFTGFNFIRDYWDVIREFMQVDLKSQGDAFFADENGPSAPDLLPVPPLINPPQAPETPEPSRIENLIVDLFYDAKIGGIAVGVDLGLNIIKQGGDTHSDVEKVIQAEAVTGEGYGFHDQFKFVGNIDHAEKITSVVISKNQTTASSDLNFKINVMAGQIKSGSDLLEALAGRIIASNRTIPASGGNGDYPFVWAPAAGLNTTASTSSNEEYNTYITNRNNVIAENQNRQSAYDALIQNNARFKSRLQSIILRRRHFFTRVILNAIEPEQIKSLLDTLLIFSEDKPNRKIPLHAIAHTQPIGMTAGAFVLRIKRFTLDSAKRLRELLNLQDKDENGEEVDSGLFELLTYSSHIHKMEAEYKDPKQAHERDSTAHVYLPTSGLFAEALLGRANSAEHLDMQRYFDWNDSPVPHQPPAVGEVKLGSRYQQTDIDPSELKSPLNVINAPSFPEPSGIKDVLAAIQNGSMFRDMSKATELAGILQNLMSLSGNMGKAAANLTGNAAKDAMDSAVKMGEVAAKLSEKMFEKSLDQAGAAFAKMTEKGAAINAARKNLPEGADLEDTIKDIILGIPGGVETSDSDSSGTTEADNDEGTSGEDETSNSDVVDTPSNLATTQLPQLPKPGQVTQVKAQDSEASKVFRHKAEEMFLQGGTAGPDSDELVAIGLQWYQDSVLPRLKQASNDDRFLISALKDWLDWTGNMATLGIDSAQSGSAEMASAEDEAKIWVEGGLRNAVHQAQQRAIDTNNIEYLKDAVDWSANAEILGFADASNRLGANEVIEDFPIQVDLFDVQYPPEVALNVATTFSATAALKIGNNDPIFKPALFWELTVIGGSISGLSRGQTNSGGGFSTVINRTSDTNFELSLEVKYMDGVLMLKSIKHVFKPGLST